MIELKNVSKTYNKGKSFVVKDFNLTIEEGEIIILLGSSGCGKTTTLKMINRLEEPSSGHIYLDGKDIAEKNPVTLRRHIGYVFQGIGLFPHLSVAENVVIVLRLLGVKDKERSKKANELLELVNLDPKEYANRRVDELSGGQQQRVGVARALANDPKYLLMDEPFGALDSITRDSLQEEILRLNQQLHKTIIFVTHDIFEALRLADRIVVMDKGLIQQVGSKEALLHQPANDFVKDLIQMPINQMQRSIEALEQSPPS